MIPFSQVAHAFRVIDSPAHSVLIDTDANAHELIATLRSGMRSRELMREAGQYAVSVYDGQIKALLARGALEVLGEELFVLRDHTLYSEKTGLTIPDEGGQGIVV